MAHLQEILFIVNFFSGTKSKDEKDLILSEIKKTPHTKIVLTEYPNHAAEIAQQAIEMNIKKVVAVGGDGTINEIASVLRGSEISLGIVPIGSGNGLARDLKIPMDYKKAIDKAISGQPFEMDTCTVNDIPFFCTAGIGFDAFVADKFSKKGSRGFLTYILSTIESFFTYKPISVKIEDESKISSETAFAITFANASQYGNDAVVAPDSKIDDGLLDMVILHPFSFIYSIGIIWRLFHKSFSKSKFVQTVKGAKFKIYANSPCLIHFDGEPKLLYTSELVFEISSKKLQVII